MWRGARVIEAVLGVPYNWGVLGFALTVSLYTAYGGFRAVAWTDAFQAVVMLFGVLITAGFAIWKMGGLSAVFDELVAQSPDLVATPGPDNFLPPAAAISFFCVWALASPAQPALITRFLACRDTKALKRACFLIGVYIALLYPCVIGIGIVGRALVPELEAADHATPATIMSAVPPVLAGFVLAAPLAAIMSTISSFLLVSSSAIVRDLYERNLPQRLSERRARILSHAATFFVAGGRVCVCLAAAAVLAVHCCVRRNRAGGDVLVPDGAGGLLAADEQGRLPGRVVGRVSIAPVTVRGLYLARSQELLADSTLLSGRCWCRWR